MARISAYKVSRIVIVVVGVLIAAAVVIGVIFLLHNRGEQVRHDQASQIADQQIKDQQEAEDTTTDTSSETSTEEPAEATATPTVAVVTELPTTGASDSIVPILTLALLTFAATSFVVSHKRAKAL